MLFNIELDFSFVGDNERNSAHLYLALSTFPTATFAPAPLVCTTLLVYKTLGSVNTENNRYVGPSYGQ
jgi:hypothetical protein